MKHNYDIIIVGGGHAGVEAAMIASKLGCRIGIVSMDKQSIGRMSCNPAIGGVAKGQIVREVDILGGLMGRVSDRSGLQFKVLNKSKGQIDNLIGEIRLRAKNNERVLVTTLTKKMAEDLTDYLSG